MEPWKQVKTMGAIYFKDFSSLKAAATAAATAAAAADLPVLGASAAWIRDALTVRGRKEHS